MHRRRGVTLMVEEVRRRIADRGWILIEDRPSRARARRVDDAVRRRMLQHLVEGGAPVVQPQIEASSTGLFTHELLVGGIQSKPHGRELRDLRGQQGNGEMPPAEFMKDLEFLPEIGERDRGLLPSVVAPAGEYEE